MFRKVTVLAILIALVVASFPTVGVFAKSARVENLEAQWETLTKAFSNQSARHELTHRNVTLWLKENKDASASDKAKIQVHLAQCNTAFASAQALVTKHAGFDAKGKVIDVAAATKSVKDLKFYLSQHSGTIKQLGYHIN